MGTGVPQSDEMANSLYKTGAKLGNMMAQNNLANSYALGRGLKIGCMKALYWYEKSAENGYQEVELSVKTFSKFCPNNWGRVIKTYGQ